MKIIADLHIHSKYSRGCSRELTLENISKWCQYKGINVVSTGDFTHPVWFKEIKEKLEPAEAGLYKLKNDISPTRFIIGTEISCIYTQGGKCRRIHLCLMAPQISDAEKLIEELTKRGCNLKSDGRPIIGLSAKELARIAWEINADFFVFPAHVWTPWFAVFGSKSGFNSLLECFEELTGRIFAIETGLSSDPAMNRRLSQLDSLALISNSDAHSLANLGREANVFNLSEISFNNLISAIKNKQPDNFLYTIEFFPEEGKYHIDGHAVCNYSCSPEQSKKNNNLCPQCGKPLILGVLNRVQELSDQAESKIKNLVPFKSIIPLQEIIADYLSVGKASKKVQALYFSLVSRHPEFEILIDQPLEKLQEIMEKELSELIMKARRGELEIIPGYDGVFGRISIKNPAGQQQEKVF